MNKPKKIPLAKLRELELAIVTLNEYEKLEIKMENGKVDILRRSLYKETFDLEEEDMV